MFLKLAVLSAILLSFGLVALAIRILIYKDGKFPNSSVGANPHLKKMGIHCARCEELKKFRQIQKNKKVKIHPDKIKIIASKNTSAV